MGVIDAIETKGFFVAGGTLPLDSGSYMERAADQNLLRSLTEGRFCYVLNSRQMGKSSLCVRTMARLAQQGVRCAFIDITKIGGRNVTPEQWYAGLAIEIGRTLDLRTPILEYWKTEAHLGPMQRFFGALRDVVLASIPGHVVVFVDEIDSTRSLSFNTDEFFAGVRECFNRRVQDPEYNRLTFCFLGVAVPSDLIHDARTTPFNIGDRIYLKDFTYEELQPLAKQLGANGEAVLQRVYYWTNGHPFLTQSVCRALTLQGHGIEVKDVDALIQRDLLEPKVRETNINLSDVGNRVLNGYADGDDVDQYRADILSAYDKALAGRTTLPDDESNRVTAVLKLSGLMRSDGGTLKVRNRIYEKAFNRAWVRENMPGQELRRQRIAYYAGVVRTTLVAAAVIAIIGFLAFSNYRMARAAEATAREMSWRAYVADMNRLPILVEQNNVPFVDKLLDDHKNDPWRGAEWDYWKGTIHTALWEATKEFGKFGSYNPSGHLPEIMVSSQTGGLLFINRMTGKVARRMDLPAGPRYVQLRGGKRLLSGREAGGGELLDAETGKVLRTIPPDIYLHTYGTAVDAEGRYCIADRATTHGVLDLESLEFVVERTGGLDTFFTDVTADGRYALLLNVAGSADTVTRYDLALRKPTASFSVLGRARASAVSLDHKTLTVGFFDGKLRRFDYATGKLLWELEIGKDTITIIGLSADAQTVVVGTRRRRSYQVRVQGGQPRAVRSYLDAAYPTISADGKFIYTLYWTMRAYPADDGEPVKTMDLGGDWATNFVRNPDRLMLAGPDRVHIYPIVDGSLGKGTVLRYPKGIQPWALIETQPTLLFSDSEGIRVTDVGDGLRDVFKVKGKPLNEHAFRLDANRMLLTKDRLTFTVYDLPSGKPSTGTLRFDDVTSFQLSPQGDRLLAMSDMGLSLYDAFTLRRLWNLPNAHEREILTSAFSRDGTLVASAAHDDTAAVWDTRTGRMISRLEGHAQSVTGVDLTPDGKRAITVSDDQTMRFWDVQTGAELTTLGNVGDFPDICTITEDGKYVVTGDELGKIKIWPLYPPGSTPKKP